MQFIGGAPGRDEKMASPYGFWKSPITSDLVVADSIRLEQVMLDGDAIYWTETQPQKRGRTFAGSGANSRRRKASRVVLSRLQAWSTAFHTAGASRPWTPRRPSPNCPLADAMHHLRYRRS